jgi:hypothetical protein
MKKTRLDLILDKVKCGKREVTFDLDGYTPTQRERVRAAAKARGLDAAGHGRWLLVRDLACKR